MTTQHAPSHRIACGEVWGGIKNADISACTGAAEISLFSSSCNGHQGGDIYYVSTCSGDLMTRIAVADVLGHGKHISAISRWVYKSLQLNSGRINNARLLEAWNRRIVRERLSPMTTAVTLSVVPTLGRIFLSCAGHPPVLICRAEQKAWEPLELPDLAANNYPLGVEADTAYDQHEIATGPGDRLLLYTDGVIESLSGSGVPFGLDGLIDALNTAGRRSLSEAKDFVLDRVRQHAGGQFDQDDVTVLAVEIAPAESKSGGTP